MSPSNLKEIEQLLNTYKRGGSSSYRRIQVKRLISILDDIFAHEPKCFDRINAVGRRQIIGYYKRHSNEKMTTLIEKWRVLSLLFELKSLKAPVHPASVIKE